MRTHDTFPREGEGYEPHFEPPSVREVPSEREAKGVFACIKSKNTPP